LYDIVMHPTLG